MKMSTRIFKTKILINEKKMKGRVSGENQSKMKPNHMERKKKKTDTFLNNFWVQMKIKITITSY